MKLNVEYSVSALSCGKAGTCGIVRKDDGTMEFIGFGFRSQILKLRLCIRDEILTEQSCPLQIIMRQERKGHAAWAVIADSEWKYCASTDDPAFSFSCIAIIKYPTKWIDPYSDSKPTPVCFLAHFDEKCSALTAIRDDLNLCKILDLTTGNMGCVPLNHDPQQSERSDLGDAGRN